MSDKFFSMTFVFLILAILSFFCVIGILLFGSPNFSNLDNQRVFCSESGGFPIEPSRQTYNQMICFFKYNGTYVEYVASKITNKDWAEHFGKEVGDYCFSCWDDFSCGSLHNNILREKELHC